MVWIATYDGDYTFPFARGILHYIGSRSYGIYITHNTAFYFAKEIGFRIASTRSVPFDGSFSKYLVPGGITLSFLFAELSFRFLENPLRNKGKEIASKLCGSKSAIGLTTLIANLDPAYSTSHRNSTIDGPTL